MIKIDYYKSSLGELIIGSYGDSLCLCDWRYRKMRTYIDKRIQETLDASYVKESSAIIEETREQLQQYLNAGRTAFDIPLLLAGSDFQKVVWKALLQIPYGHTETYLGLSKLVGNEKAIRAVAAANGANAISILVPCHRIIGSDGKLTGYAGGISTKRKLLEIENVHTNDQLSLFN